MILCFALPVAIAVTTVSDLGRRLAVIAGLAPATRARSASLLWMVSVELHFAELVASFTLFLSTRATTGHQLKMAVAGLTDVYAVIV